MDRNERWIRGVTGLAVMALAAAGLTGPAAAAATASTTVSVNATGGLGSIPSNAIGLNTAVYDGHMNDPAIPGLSRPPASRRCAIPAAPTRTSTTGRPTSPRAATTRRTRASPTSWATAQATGTNPIITVELRHRHRRAGRGVGAERRRHQQLRDHVLGGRQRGLRQRDLRRELGGRQPLHRRVGQAGDRRQRAGPDLQLRPGHVRGQRAEVQHGDEGGEPEHPRVRGADHARVLAGRRDQRRRPARSPGTRPC